MSVPEGKRSQSKLEAIMKARDLAAYTMKIRTNEKVFDPKYEDFLTKDIVDTAKDIYNFRCKREIESQLAIGRIQLHPQKTKIYPL